MAEFDGNTKKNGENDTCTYLTTRSKRKRVLASKLKDDYEVDIQAYCPECNEYVAYSENGVVCASCVAYWHLKCANTTAEEVEKLGDAEFYCPKHKGVGLVCADTDVSLETLCGGSTQGTEGTKCTEGTLDKEVRNIRVSQYVLNDKEISKHLLKKMDNSNDIELKDKGKQYLLVLNTVTYFIISGSLATLGEQYGIEVKRNDVDLKGTNEKVQYNIMLVRGSLKIPITMIFYHTTANVQLQLKGRKKEGCWMEKLNVFAQFINGTLREMIEKVRGMSAYNDVRVALISDLSKNVGLDPLSMMDTNGDEASTTRTAMSQEKRVVAGDNCDIGLPTENNVVPEDNCVIESIPGGLGISDTTINSLVVEENCNIVELITPVNDDVFVDDASKSENSIVIVEEPSSEGTSAIAEVLKTCDPSDVEVGVLGLDGLTEKEDSISDTVLGIVSSVDKLSQEKECVSSQAVVKRKSDNGGKKMIQAFDVLKMHKNWDARSSSLYGIILKLKERGLEMKEEYSKLNPPLVSERLNSLSLKLVQKQNELDTTKKQNKDLEGKLKDLKKEKLQLLNDLKEYEQDSAKKNIIITDLKDQLENKQAKTLNEDDEIMVMQIDDLNKQVKSLQGELDRKCNELEDLAQSQSDMVMRCRSLEGNNTELHDKLLVLEAVSGQVKGNVENEVVVVHAKSTDSPTEHKKEIESLNKKIEKLNKENSVLKDQVTAKTNEFEKVDDFYKEILVAKEEVISSLTVINNSNTEVEKKFRRLLMKFRSEQELKSIRDLKVDIEHKSNVIESVRENTNVEENGPVENSVRCGDKNIDKHAVVKAAEVDHAKKKLCKFGTKCNKKSSCEYSHEVVHKSCRFGDRCNKKEACLFLHEINHEQHGMSGRGDCRNWGEFEERNNSRGYVSDAFGMPRPEYTGGLPNFGVPRFPGVNALPRFGVANQPHYGGYPRLGHGASFSGVATETGGFRDGHSGQISPLDRTNKMCREGMKCSSMDKCTFSHKKISKDCKFGNECKWLEKCLFRHTDTFLCSKNEGSRA